MVTLATAVLGACAAMVQVYRLWRIHPSGATAFRSISISALAWAVCAKWTVPLTFLPLKLLLVTLMIATAYVFTGEFQLRDITSFNRFHKPRFREPEVEVLEGSSGK